MSDRVSVAVVVADFYEDIASGLLEGAVRALRDSGVTGETVVTVGGAWEMPVVARALAGSHDCVIALGAVIEGETDHYRYIAGEAARGLQQVALDTGVPVAFGVLTTRARAHAEARSAPDDRNKGAEAARAALRAVRAIRAIGGNAP